MSLSPAEEGYHVPSDIPIKYQKRASLDPKQEKSMIKETDLRKLRISTPSLMTLG